ncbi:MAG: LysM domain/BON superfamily protein [Elusimicrobia bacterium ADurb.Bin231]|nr:MAG: LysM domain/BON superfamily protein [Elusimicrobia bacterium ADurb.Bin231]
MRKWLILLFFIIGYCTYCYSADVLKVYKVERGDTLSSIAEKFYGDPLAWEKIHQLNKYINDPHWIFPGDELLVLVKDTEPPADIVKSEVEEVKKDSSTVTVSQIAVSTVPADSGSKDISITISEFQYSGRISSSQGNKIMISQCDTVLINTVDKDQRLSPGRYTIFRVERGSSGHDYGSAKDNEMLREIGVLDIPDKSVGDGDIHTYIGDIIMAHEPVYIGDVIKLRKSDILFNVSSQ